jgi:hypothetical protein
MPQEAISAGTDIQGGNGNLAGDSMSTAQAPDGNQVKNLPAPADNSSNLAGITGMNNNMNGMNFMGGTGGANAFNSIGLNSVMNAMLMNNAIQQQQAQGMNMMMGINPMMVPQMGQMCFPQGMINPAMGVMGGMGNFYAKGGGNMNVPSVDNSGATAANNNAPQGNGADFDGSDLLAQLMMNPMAMQMMAQGINPMILLGMGGMGQNQLGNANAPAALSMGMKNMGTNVPDGAGGFSLPMMANTAPGGATAGAVMANTTSGDSTAAPAPLFAFNNTTMMPRDMGMVARGDGVLKQPVINLKTGKKSSKKIKIKNKPKRPLSAYNFFFREERARILDSIPKPANKKKDSNDDGDIEVEKKMGNEDDRHREEDAKRKIEEEDLIDTKVIKKEKVEETADNDVFHDDVSAKKGDENDETDDKKDYDNVGVDGKKIPHGKIGFENLAKEIGKRWQNLEPNEMEKFKKLADMDMTRYKREMEAFLAKEAQAVGAAGDGNLMAASVFTAFSTNRSDYGGDVVKPKKKRSKNISMM